MNIVIYLRMSRLRERQVFWDRQAESWETHQVFGSNKEWFRSYVTNGYRDILGYLPNSPLRLDIGAGAHSGFYSFDVEKLVSTDISERMLSKSRQDMRVLLDAESSLPFKDNSFDLVTSYFTMRYVTNQIDVVSEIVRVLKPSGIFYIVDLYSNGYAMQRGHFLPHTIRNILKHNFEGIHVDSHDDGLASTSADFMLGSVYGSKDYEVKINWRKRFWPQPQEVMPF